MAEARESRLRHGLESLARLGVTAESAAVEALAKALDADADAGLAIADLLGAIATPESAELLARIEAGAQNDKLLRREARRSLYRLKQRGIAAPQAPTAQAPAARPALGGPEAEGLLSISDARGDRLFWIVKPRPGGGLLHLSTVVNEPSGLKEAVLAEVNRKSMRALREELQARHGLRMVEADWRYADAISAEGYERARGGGQVPDSAAHYPQLRLQLFAAAAKPWTSRLHESRGDVEADLASSASLLEEPELRHWLLGEADLAPSLARYREMRDSPIVLDRAQQLSRLDEIVQSAVAESFAAERAASWERRLDETAYFFAKTSRQQAAARAGAVATAVAARKSGQGIPFCEELVRRSFGVFFEREAEREREEKAGSVLVTPDDIRAEQARARQRRR
jgi:hypothetical protein